MTVPDQEAPKRRQWVKYVGVVAAATVGGALAVTVGAPVVVGAFGFGSGGIVAGSLAAKAMSIAATSGWGMGAVGMAQSVGAAGVGAATTVAGGAVGGGVYAAANGFKGGNAEVKEDDGVQNKNTGPDDHKQSTNVTEPSKNAVSSFAAKIINGARTNEWGTGAMAQSVGAAGVGAATTVAGAVSGGIYAAAQGLRGGKRDNKICDAGQNKDTGSGDSKQN